MTRFDDFLVDAKGYLPDRPPASTPAPTDEPDGPFCADLGGRADISKVHTWSDFSVQVPCHLADTSGSFLGAYLRRAPGAAAP